MKDFMTTELQKSVEILSAIAVQAGFVAAFVTKAWVVDIGALEGYDQS
jgi:hypothetical protein